MKAQSFPRLTDRPIVPTLLYLSWPIIVGQFLQLSYNLADTFWVGKLGPVYLAAISISFPLIFVVFSVAAGFSISGVALVSQYTGANQKEKADLAAGQVVLIALGLSVVFSSLGLIFGQYLLRLVGAGDDVLPHAWAYFRIITGGIPLIFLYFIFTAVLEGVGDTITPMKIKVASVLFNIILDPFIIFGWGFFPAWGIQGAAIATVLTRFAGALVATYILVTGRKGLQIRLKHLIPDLEMIKKIFRIGVPSAVGMSAISTAMTVMTGIVAVYGTFTVAAWGVGTRIFSLFVMIAIGLSRGTAILVGQHLGAGQPEHAGRTAFVASIIVFVLMVSVAGVIWLFASEIMGLFSEETRVVEIGTGLLRIGSFGYAFLGVLMVLGGALQGAGKTMERTFFDILEVWVIQIPLALLLSRVLGMGKEGIWWAVFIAKVTGSVLIAIWVSRGTWKTKVIEESPPHTPLTREQMGSD